MTLIGHHGSVADARVVIDGDVQLLVTDAADVIARVAGDGMAGAIDIGQALDIEVDQVAGMLVFVAHYGGWRVERLEAVHAGAAQAAADRGTADGQFASDAPAVPAQPAKSKNPF